MSPAAVDPRAAVDPAARLGDGVVVAPFAVVGPDVEVGPGTWVGPHVVLEGRVTIGADNRIFAYAAIGYPPQDFSYRGEPTEVVIGDRNVIRESCTIHRGTPHGGGTTRLGDDNYLMVGAHVAHDCQIAHHVLFANAGSLAGHVEVGEHAFIGPFTGVHQFCRVGAFAYVGGYAKIVLDPLPYCTTTGSPGRCFGVNRIGMRRRGVDAERVMQIDAAVRAIFRPGLRRPDALAAVEAQWGELPEVRRIIEFIRGSRRGVAGIRPGGAGEEA